MAGFPWSECQVRKLTTSHCTETEDHEMVENNVCEIRMIHTGECTVTACRTNQKCEKEATFFMASQVMRITLKAYDHRDGGCISKENYRNCKEKRITGERTGTTSY